MNLLASTAFAAALTVGAAANASTAPETAPPSSGPVSSPATPSSKSDAMCSAAILGSGGKPVTGDKGETLLSTEECSWYQSQEGGHLRRCKVAEAPIGQCYIPAASH